MKRVNVFLDRELSERLRRLPRGLISPFVRLALRVSLGMAVEEEVREFERLKDLLDGSGNSPPASSSKEACSPKEASPGEGEGASSSRREDEFEGLVI